MNRDFKLIQDAIAREGRIEGGQIVVPDDFFSRLNAKLNEGSNFSGLIDRLIEAADAKQ